MVNDRNWLIIFFEWRHSNTISKRSQNIYLFINLFAKVLSLPAYFYLMVSLPQSPKNVYFPLSPNHSDTVFLVLFWLNRCNYQALKIQPSPLNNGGDWNWICGSYSI